jgi:hypothetical protein
MKSLLPLVLGGLAVAGILSYLPDPLTAALCTGAVAVLGWVTYPKNVR